MPVKIDNAHAVERLTAAITGMKGLTPESLNYDAEAFENCLNTMLWLQTILDDVQGTPREEPQARNALVDENLLLAVALRVCSLQSDIEFLFKSGDQAVAAREDQIQELCRQGYSQEEALKLHPADDLEELLGEKYEEIHELQGQHTKLREFLADPAYDIRILAGTEFEQPAPVSH